MKTPQCRFCHSPLTTTFADLGMSPPSNSFVVREQLTQMERFYPLHAFVCSRCFLVQLEEFESPSDIFTEYAYFSSFSTSWLTHCERYADAVVDSLALNEDSLVVEIASNDGYLLQYFQRRNVPVLGVEPAANVAKKAVEQGIPTIVEFFGAKLATDLRAQGKWPDLVIGNNVLAHVPDINDFVAGVKILLKQGGTATFEFPHLLRLIESVQFDTIYHEHFSYLSLLAASQIFARHGLEVVNVDELPTHGGSLRLYVKHVGEASVSDRVNKVLGDERAAGLDDLETYEAFRESIERTKRALLSFLIRAKEEGKRVAGYGAAAKGTTLLNYCGVRSDFLDYIVDRNPYKQHRFLPGCHIPILPPEKIFETKPDFIIILPWNIKDEVISQMSDARSWGAKFVIPVPTVEVY